MSVISTATNLVTATVTGLNAPYGVAITPNGLHAYVADYNNGDVSVISTATNLVTATVTSLTHPNGVAIIPNGSYAYVANQGASTVSVISTATNTVTATVTVGTTPYGVAITPNGAFAYVGNSGSGTVSVISTATNAVTAAVTVGSGPWGVAITPNGSYAYVANQGGSTVSVMTISPIAQVAPFVGSVATGIAYSSQLVASGSAGAITYVTTSTSPNVAVSSTGAVTSPNTTPAGTYTVSGTDSDPSANNGTWTFTLNVATAPTVTGVNPGGGPPAGGTAVTVTGTGFEPGSGGTTATFGTVAASSVSCSSTTTCVFTSPAQAAGVADITVTNETGTSATVAADHFTYEATPTVTGITPAAGGTAGTDVVTISGTGFVLGSTTVAFGASAGTSVSCSSSTSCTATSPGESAGVVDVTVTTPGGTSATSPADQFTYDATPSVTAVSPVAGSLASGTVVTITGTGFMDSIATTGVKFAGTNAASYLINSDTQITATSPGGSPGVADITVTNETGTSATVAADHFTYEATPTVTGITPAAGGTAGTDVVTISGTGFVLGSTTVAFGASAGTSVSCSSSTSCTATSPGESAGVVDVTVTTPGGMSSSGSSDHFTYDATPSVTGITPVAGPIAGGTVVTITGTGFADASGASFAGNASSYTIVSDTSITATSPAGTAGTVDITVTNETGTSSTSSADHFTYDATPSVTGITPVAGPIAGGTVVTITGTGFADASGASFAGNAASYTIVSDTSITATTPAHAAGVVDVTVTNETGTSSTGSSDHFTYDATPSVTGITPVAGPIAGGTVVTITGTGFVVGSSTAKFGTSSGTSVSCSSSTSCTATSPGESAGVVDVTVTTPGGMSSSGSSDHFTYDATPSVTGITPVAGPIAGGTVVTITGTGFADASGASFAGNASSYTIVSDTSITATSPAQAAGTVDITVTNETGTSSTGSSDHFTYDATPSVTGITPVAGPIAGGTVVTITGTGFVVGSSTAKFGTSSGTSVSCSSSTSCTATSPGESAGVVDVTVTTPGGMSSSGSSDHFTYDATPSVTGITPVAGPIAGGTVVTITGTGFADASGASFAGNASSYTIVSDTSITATTPAHAAGVVDVTVTNETGTSSTGSSDHFTYDATPSVTGITPVAGPIAGGTVVTITGTGFVVGSSTAKFGTSSGTSVSCSSSTSCTATSPGESAGVVDVTVTTPGGMSSSGSSDHFTYDATPSVTGITPVAGPIAGGTVVTITGTGFADASGASFAGNAASYTIVSDTSITATTPAHAAGVVDVTVTNETGTSSTGSSDHFTYDATPSVTGITPVAGPIAGGTVVTITGTGFVVGSSTAKFGTSSGTSVSCSSSTSCTATSPGESAGVVDVTVTTPGGMSSSGSSDHFTYDATPSVTGITPVAGPIAGGTVVTITGTGFADASGASFAGNASSYTIVSDTSITATSPAGTAGTVDITVTNETGTSSTGSSDHFTYDATPSVTGITPVAGPIAGGTVVTITGTGFVVGSSTAKFGTSSGTSVSCSSSTSCTATSPGESAGVVDVTVTTPGGMSSSGSSDHFTYDATPSVTGITPVAGPIAGGTVVTITGTGFADASGASFAGNASSYTIVSDTSITATSPAGTAGTVDITVTNETGTSSTSSSDHFTYDATPSVTGITPVAGPIAGGTVVTITGTGFADTSGASFAGNAASYTIVSDTSITATTPAHAAGVVDVTVTNETGTSSTGSSDHFTYDATPSVTGITPVAGPIAGGTVVTITGTGFLDSERGQLRRQRRQLHHRL